MEENHFQQLNAKHTTARYHTTTTDHPTSRTKNQKKKETEKERDRKKFGNVLELLKAFRFLHLIEFASHDCCCTEGVAVRSERAVKLPSTFCLEYYFAYSLN